MTKPILAMIGGFVLASSMFIGGLVFAVVFLVPGGPWQQPVRVADMSEIWNGVPRRAEATGREVARVVTPIDRTSGVEAVGARAASDPVVTASAKPSVERTRVAIAAPADVQAVVEQAKAKVVPLPAEAANNPAAARLYQAHAQWCGGRYRSYDSSDNSYRPYSGGRRACFSPFIAEYAALTGTAAPEDRHVKFAPTVTRPAPAVMETAVYQGEALVARKAAVGPVETRSTMVAESTVVADSGSSRDCSHYRTYDPADNTYQPYGGGPRRRCE
jgi:hypothetical protein